MAVNGLADMVGAGVGLILTLMVFSYLLGDNALFRVAIHIFIGVAAGYTLVITWYNVIMPQLVLPLLEGSPEERMYVAFPLLLSGLLLLKISPRFSRLGNPAMAYLVGVGGATAVGGAIMGTLFPQIMASINIFEPQTTTPAISSGVRLLQGSAILVGTVTSLAYFHFGTKSQHSQLPQRAAWIEALARIGQIFIGITLGVIFAGVYLAAMAALVERVYFIRDFILAIGIGPG